MTFISHTPNVEEVILGRALKHGEATIRYTKVPIDSLR